MNANEHLNKIETNLNLIFEHCHEGKETMEERRQDIERLAREAKKSFDWIDNFTIIKLDLK